MAQGPERTYCARRKTRNKSKRKKQRWVEKKDHDGVSHPGQGKSNKKKNETLKVIMQK